MSSLYALGSRPQAAPVPPAAAQAGGKAYGAQLAPASGNLAARLPVVDPVSLRNQNVSLSTQSLERTGQLAGDTLDAAQKLIDTFVNQLFGDQAKGATVAFDSVSLEAQSSFSASSSQVSNADGTTRSAAFALDESASFIGKGQLVTADGQSFDFEIEINYAARIEASATRTSRAAAPSDAEPGTIAAPDVMVLTGKPLPAIKYPGSLDDLFKLLGKELSGSVTSNEGRADEAQAGNLTLRLLRLVDRAALLAPREHTDEAQPAPVERSKAAGSYAAQAGSAAIG